MSKALAKAVFLPRVSTICRRCYELGGSLLLPRLPGRIESMSFDARASNIGHEANAVGLRLSNCIQELSDRIVRGTRHFQLSSRLVRFCGNTSRRLRPPTAQCLPNGLQPMQHVACAMRLATVCEHHRAYTSRARFHLVPNAYARRICLTMRIISASSGQITQTTRLSAA